MEIGSEDYNKYVASLLKLNPTETYEIAKELLEKEEEFISKWGSGCTRTFHTLCWILSLERKESDIWRIWQCKCLNNDTYCSIDINWIYLFFDTVVELKDYIFQSDHPDKENLLKRVEQDQKTWLTDNKLSMLPKTNFKVSENYILYGTP